jgi:hypothetical protein
MSGQKNRLRNVVADIALLAGIICACAMIQNLIFALLSQ